MHNAILVTNDDGINSIGLKAIVDELNKNEFDMYVVAPSTQVSGSGKSHTFHVKVSPFNMKNAVKSWAVDGRPADAVAIAIKHLLKGVDVKIIVSGINIGPNIGTMDFFTSGTIGAALEGVLFGKKSIAISLGILRGIRSPAQVDLLYNASRIAGKIVKMMLSEMLNNNAVDLININFPPTKPLGIKFSFLSWQSNISVKVEDKENCLFHVMGWETDNINEAYDDGPEGSDTYYLKRGFITITPLCLRCAIKTMVNERLYEKLQKVISDLDLMLE